MNSELQAYRDYKESGSHWLGMVPRHWDIQTARHIGRFLKGVGGSKEDSVPEGIPCVRYGELYGAHNFFILATRGFISPPRMKEYTPLQYGDVLFAASGETISEIGKSAVNLLRTVTYCGGDIVLLRPTIDLHAPFLGYALDCRPAANQKATMCRGSTIKHIYPDELRSLTFPLPPLNEQVIIARYLNWSNGKIDRAIRAKRKVIALLNEQKQAIIHRAVTRGVDPSVPLKPSGIPWLGQIPVHWRIVRNLALFSHRVERGVLGLGVLQVSLHSGVTAEDSEKSVRKKRFMTNHTKYKLVRKNDLAYNTMRMWQGAVGVCPDDGLVSPAYVVIKPRQNTDSRFYELVFRIAAYKQQVNRYSTGIVSDRNRLYWDNFKQMPNVFLPIEEQQKICSYIQFETKGLNTAISQHVREIDLLREYRTRLVADVVTGKLDVREAAKNLPEESSPEILIDDADLIDESEPLDEEAAE